MCEFCDSLFSSMEKLQSHKKRKHESYTGEKKKFSCDLCNYSTNQTGHFNRHKLTHSKIKNSHKCHLCGKIFGRKDHLKAHIKSVHEKIKFMCELCSKECSYKSDLTKHIKNVHEKQKPHVCPVCGKKFAHKSTLDTHILTHTGEKPHKCNFCEQSFSTSSSLKRHIKSIHEKIKFKC